jgi:signal transduction histidine kinase
MSDHRCMRGLRTLPWLAGVGALALATSALVLNALAGDQGEDWSLVALLLAGALSSLGVGLILAVRRPRNPLGWLLLANALVLSLEGTMDSYARYAALAEPGALPGGDWAALFSDSSWPLLFVCPVAIAYVFPDGRLPSRRWRMIAVIGAASFALMLLLAPFSPEDLNAPFDSVDSPLPSLSFYFAITPFLLLGMAVALVGAVIALRSRFRRSGAIERLQIKWLALAATLIPATLIACIVQGVITGSSDVAAAAGVIAIEIAIPAAIGVAVLRYRLYEIDRLVSATIVYLTLTALLGLGFAGVSVALGVALGGGSTLPTAAATLLVVLAFRPLRDRIQTMVDHRFNRARYEALTRVDGFLAELRTGRVEPESLGAMLADALRDPTLLVFFWLPADGCHADAAGRIVDELPATPRARTPVSRGDLRLGTLVHDPALADGGTLLQDVIVSAGLAFEIARLRVEVRRRLAEVEESRTRIVTATYEERRRLERDLHDGAQQRLVSIGLDLRHLQHELGQDSAETRKELDAVVAALADAIEELRELARGVRPSALDGGLAPALRELASRAPITTEVETVEDRFDTRIEAAAFFVASEALTNSVKHAGASRVTMNAARRNGNLVLRITDDGRGGAAPRLGSGLTGLADRVEALGGRLDVRSAAGEGTTLIAELPCE